MKIAILGFGVVGSGTYDIIQENKETISKKAGEEISVKYIVDIRDFTGTPYENLVVNDFSIVENDPEVDVVVEVIGGTGVSLEFTKRALNAGKHVVTSNKELVATHGTELLKIANEKGLNYLFEASVGGGIPVIRPLVQCLSANEILGITGIVNGTTNYILSQMINNNTSFEDALKDAQAKGYAEQNPTADICGIDAQRKICILTNLAYGKEVNPDDVLAEGITEITLDDVYYANKGNKVIKLLARTENQNGQIFTFVAPHLVDKTNMLSLVEDVFNAVMIRGNMVDETLFYGQGAGKLPTASAVVADVIDACKHKTSRRYIDWVNTGKYIADMEDFSCKYFVKIKDFKECPSFADVNLSDDDKNEVAFITSDMKMSEFKLKMQDYNNYSYIRVL